MKNLQTLQKKLSCEKDFLLEKYNVKKIGIFGSFVRNEQNSKSDIDILVEFHNPPGLFQFIRLETYLSKKLGLKVDLVSKKALKPNIGKSILDEVVMI